MDRWLKRLWLLIGLVVFPLLVHAAYAAASEAIRGRTGEPVVELPARTPDSLIRPRAVRASMPDSVRGGPDRIVLIYYGEAQSGTYSSESARAYFEIGRASCRERV